MGTQGLWSYFQSHGIVRSFPEGQSMSVDYLLLDMNSVVHCSFVGDVMDSQKIIGSMLASVRELLRVFPPRKGFICVFDGVAPIAKVPTQKQRRKGMRSMKGKKRNGNATVSECKYNFDYTNAQVVVAREELLAGSELLLACEDSLRSALNDKKIACPVAFSVRGCGEVGEGELKISYAIRTIWSSQKEKGEYTGKDVFAAVGNDSDLGLVGIACTPYENYFIVDPKTHSITDLSKLYTHWFNGVPSTSVVLERLPSFRVDFVFIMLLSGGDWFEGVGKETLNIWRRYRDLRASGAFGCRSLVFGETFDLNMEFLRAVLNVKQSTYPPRFGSKKSYKGAAGRSQREGVGLDLLKGALWALKSIVSGRCVDYNFHVNPKRPALGDLCAATKCKGVGSLIHPDAEAVLPCFSPLGQCLAVLGRRGRYSAEVMRAMNAITQNMKSDKLTESLSTPYLVKYVRLIMEELDHTRLTTAEQALSEIVSYDGGSCESFMTF